MQLTAQQVFDAGQVLNAIIAAGRGFPAKGAYRLARLQAKLRPEFDVIEQRRNALILAYDHVDENGVGTVPPDKADEFRAAWAEIAGEIIELQVEPIPLEHLDPGCVPGLLTVQELMVLGDLVTE